jgi:hypothetical protein
MEKEAILKDKNAEVEQYREQIDEMLRSKQRLMHSHNEDLEERDAMIERMKISNEELQAKKDKA